VTFNTKRDEASKLQNEHKKLQVDYNAKVEYEGKIRDLKEKVQRETLEKESKKKKSWIN